MAEQSLALGWLAAALLLGGCQEKLTAPGECPELCPGGQLAVIDTVLQATPGQDSSFVGYVARGEGEALLVSNGLAASEDRAIIRFPRRADQIDIGGTVYGYVIDSVAVGFTLRARDSLVDGLRVILYRLPSGIGSGTTFANVEPQLTDANLIDTVAIADDFLSGAVRRVFQGADLAKIAIPPADTGVLAVGMRVIANAPTGIRIASIAAGSAPTFTTYVTVGTTDPAQQKQTIDLNAAFNSFVSQGTPVFSNDLLLVGGDTAARALVRFDFPARLRDSASIVRATLELTPTAPLFGLPNDPTVLEARALLADLGAKSPLCISGSLCGGVPLSVLAHDTLESGSTGVVSIEVPQIVRSWQGDEPVPPSIFLILRPEAATFMRPVFGSSRAGTAPQLRISYVLNSFAGQ